MSGRVECMQHAIMMMHSYSSVMMMVIAQHGMKMQDMKRKIKKHKFFVSNESTWNMMLIALDFLFENINRSLTFTFFQRITRIVGMVKLSSLSSRPRRLFLSSFKRKI